MFYELFRIIFFIILIVVVSFILIKNKLIVLEVPKENALDVIKTKKMKLTKKSTCFLFVSCAIIFIMIAIFSYPFEGAFLRFQSIDDSLRYSIFHNRFWDNYFIENEKCYFVYSCKNGDEKYHSISKYDNGIGMVDYDSETYLYQIKGIQTDDNITSDENVKILETCAVYNKFADSTCYFVSYYKPTGTEIDNTITINGVKTECIEYKESEKSVYALIKNGFKADTVVININGKEVTTDFVMKIQQ